MTPSSLRLAMAAGLAITGSLPGLAGDGIVKLQNADPACPDDSSAIYVDCGNGTVTDNRTGLVWLQDANCIGDLTFQEAMGFAAGLADAPPAASGDTSDCGLSDGSSPGEWRLPTVDEWEEMIAAADGDPGDLDCVPPITNDDGTACWSESCHEAGFCSFTKVVSSGGFYYSSSTSLASDPTQAWDLSVDVREPESYAKSLPDFVWPVRRGQ